MLSPHKFGQRLSVPCEKTSHAKAQRDAECYVLLFLCQKSLHTEITEIHRNFAPHASAKVCAICVRQLPTPYGFCVFRGFRVRQSPHAAWHYVLFVCNLICTEDARTVRPYRSSDFPHATETPSMKKSKKVRFLTRLGGIWISRKYVVYLYREKEILPQRGYLLHFCPIFWVKKGKITRHMRKNMCRTI